jgi:hypothetical protein
LRYQEALPLILAVVIDNEDNRRHG